jgi:nicotinamidase/pyrazinamidase
METTTNREALIIVDAQRCFMPEAEGERLGVEGFGELAVNGGEAVVEPINQLTHAFRHDMRPIKYTRDQHPAETAHFSPTPNFVNTWPAHGRAGTPGGELHPELLIAQHHIIAEGFVKGDVVAATPAEDTSYTGALAHNDKGQLLPDVLRQQRVNQVFVTGLALGDGAENKLCVDSTAVDLLEQGFEVTVVTDAVEAVLGPNRDICLRKMGALGIKLATTQEVLATLESVYEGA